jgi:hypothetical protein
VRASGAAVTVGAAISVNSDIEKRIIGGGVSHGGGGGGGVNYDGRLGSACRLVSSVPWNCGSAFPIACRRLCFESKFH